MWWTYFERFAGVAEERLREHEDPVLAAADAYSYIHLVIVAGIIVFAVGVHFIVLEPTHTLADAARLTLCGGVALYLVGHLGFRLRMVGSFEREKAVVVVALLVLYAHRWRDRRVVARGDHDRAARSAVRRRVARRGLNRLGRSGGR